MYSYRKFLCVVNLPLLLPSSFSLFSFPLLQTTAHISQLLEQADGMYKMLVTRRNELDSLLTSLASGMHISSVRSASYKTPSLYC